MDTEDESFFYSKEVNDPFFSLWQKKNKIDCEEKIIYKAALCKKGKRFSFVRKRTFFVTDQYIYYKENEFSKSIKGYANYINLKGKFEIDNTNPKKPLYLIILIKNLTKTVLFTKEKSVYIGFKQALCSKLILIMFSHEYELLKIIGEGGFARVYYSKHKENSLKFAIKTFKKQIISETKDGKLLVFNEINVMRMLNHPNIIKLHEVYESPKRIYLVMDLLTGGQLRDYMERNNKKLTENQIFYIMKQLFLGLDYMHSKGIMHRDLKPENILIKGKMDNYQGSIVIEEEIEKLEIPNIIIADLGLSTFNDINLKEIVYKRCGTPGWVAPEVLKYKNNTPFYDCKCDVFSAGAILFYLITAKAPFEGTSINNILKENSKCKINFNNSKIMDCSENLKNLLYLLLEPDPEKRPDSHTVLSHVFFKNPSNHKLSNKSNSLEEISKATVKSDEINFEDEECKINDSIHQLLSSSVNRFEMMPPALNGKIETFCAISSAKTSEVELNKDSNSLQMINLSRFSEENIGDPIVNKNPHSRTTSLSLSPVKKDLAENFYKKVLLNQTLKNK